MSNQCTEKSFNYKIAYTSFAGTCPTTALDFRYSLSVLSKSQLIAEIIHFGFLAISFYELIPKNVKIPPVSASPLNPLHIFNLIYLFNYP